MYIMLFPFDICTNEHIYCTVKIFIDCIENHHSVLSTVLTGFGHFWTYPFFASMSAYFTCLRKCARRTYLHKKLHKDTQQSLEWY